MKLPKKAQKELAVLINRLQVCQIMRHEAVYNEHWGSLENWQLSEAEATVTLSDTYGIDLPGLDSARDRIAYHDTQKEVYYDQAKRKDNQNSNSQTY